MASEATDPMATGMGLLAQVREGMAVRDAGGERIGTVREVHLGSGGDPDDARRQAREAIAEVHEAMREPDRPLGVGDIEAVGVGGLSGDGGRPIGPLTGDAAADPDLPGRRVVEGTLGAQLPDDEIADEGRDRMLRQGYIRIDSAGLFAADRYATADQIARVDDQDVQLGVPRDALMAAH
jgi:hypothetical protein